MDQVQFAQGLTFREYLDKMTEARRDGFLASYQTVQLSEEDMQELARSVKTPLHVLAFSEDWCGDCRINLPVMAKLSEATPNLELRCFSRDANQELAAIWKIERIPTFVILNGNWQEIGRFVERPQSVAHALQNGDEAGKRLTRVAYNQGRFQADTVEEILDLLQS